MSRRGGIGHQTACRRFHLGEAARRRTAARRERIVAAGVENDEVHAVAGELHLLKDEARADRLDRDFPLLHDFRLQRDEVVLAAHLNPMSGVVEQPDCVTARRDQLVLQLESGKQHGLAICIDDLDDLEAEAA